MGTTGSHSNPPPPDQPDTAGGRTQATTSAQPTDAQAATQHSLPPAAVWAAIQSGEGRLLDLRTTTERRRSGTPPGATSVSLAKHIARPEGPGAIYLCQHAVRSKWTLRRGAAEVAGGFVAWKQAGLPVEKGG
jgi:rhodanese-related sulfurtransferase